MVINNYQAQQFWNDINGVIGFATSIVVLGFLFGMTRSIAKPLGNPNTKALPPAQRAKKAGIKPTVPKVVSGTVPEAEYPILEGTEEFKQFVRDTVDDFILNKEEYKSQVENLVPEVEIQDIELTGSYVKGGKPTEASDVDLLVKYSGVLDEDTVRGRLLGKIGGFGGSVFDIVVNKTELVVGTCYEDAWRFLIKQEEGELVHGEVTGADGITIKHAWVELPTGFIYEPQTARFFKPDVFKRTFSPVEDARYTVEEAAIMLSRVGKHGPWSDEERAKWLGKHHSSTSPDLISDLREGAEYEGRFWFGSYSYTRLRWAEKDSPFRKMLPMAREHYNALRVKYGLEPVTDWTKRPDDTMEKRLRKLR